MYTLYIDTHAENLVLAILKGNAVLREKRLDCNKYSHSENTIPLLKELLEECNIMVNDLAEIIVILGPGSFTGVRIGIVVAKIIAYSLKIDLKALSYLEAMALECDKEAILGIKDKNGAFIGEFDRDKNLVQDYYYLSNEDLKKRDGEIIFNKDVDLVKIKQYVDCKDNINPHVLVPLYVKKIEVEK